MNDGAFEHGARCQRDKQEGQAQLFGDAAMDEIQPGVPSSGPTLPQAPPWSESMQLAYE